MGYLTKGPTATSVLVVDDHDDIRGVIAAILERAGYSVVQAKCSREAVALFASLHSDIIVTDIFMPEGDGFEIINEMRRLTSKIPIIVVSGGWGGSGVDFLKMAHDLGATAVLQKPFKEKELLEAVAAAMCNHALTDGRYMFAERRCAGNHGRHG